MAMDTRKKIVLSGTKENILDLFKYSVNEILFYRRAPERNRFVSVKKYGFSVLQATDASSIETMDGWLESILYYLNTKQLVAILVGFFHEVTGNVYERWEFTIGDVYPDTDENTLRNVHLQFRKIFCNIISVVTTRKYSRKLCFCDALLQLQVPSVTNGDDEKDVGQVDGLAEAINAVESDEQ